MAGNRVPSPPTSSSLKRTAPLDYSFELSSFTSTPTTTPPQVWQATATKRARFVTQSHPEEKLYLQLDHSLEMDGKKLTTFKCHPKDLNAILLKTDTPQPRTHSNLTLILRNKLSHKMEMTFDLHHSTGFRNHLLERLVMRLENWSVKYSIPRNISHDRVLEIPEDDDSPPRRLQTPEGFNPAITSTMPFHLPPRPTPSTRARANEMNSEEGIEMEVENQNENGEERGDEDDKDDAPFDPKKKPVTKKFSTKEKGKGKAKDKNKESSGGGGDIAVEGGVGTKAKGGAKSRGKGEKKKKGDKDAAYDEGEEAEGATVSKKKKVNKGGKKAINLEGGTGAEIGQSEEIASKGKGKGKGKAAALAQALGGGGDGDQAVFKEPTAVKSTKPVSSKSNAIVVKKKPTPKKVPRGYILETESSASSSDISSSDTDDDEDNDDKTDKKKQPLMKKQRAKSIFEVEVDLTQEKRARRESTIKQSVSYAEKNNTDSEEEEDEEEVEDADREENGTTSKLGSSSRKRKRQQSSSSQPRRRRSASRSISVSAVASTSKDLVPPTSKPLKKQRLSSTVATSSARKGPTKLAANGKGTEPGTGNGKGKRKRKQSTSSASSSSEQDSDSSGSGSDSDSTRIMIPSQRSRQRTFSPSTTETERKRRSRHNQLPLPQLLPPTAFSEVVLKELQEKVDRVEGRLEAISRVVFSKDRFEQIADSIQPEANATLEGGGGGGGGAAATTSEEGVVTGRETRPTSHATNGGGIEFDVSFLTSSYQDLRAGVLRLSDQIQELRRGTKEGTGGGVAQVANEKGKGKEVVDNGMEIDNEQPPTVSTSSSTGLSSEMDRRLESLSSMISSLDKDRQVMQTRMIQLEQDKEELIRREEETQAREREKEKTWEQERTTDRERLQKMEEMLRRLMDHNRVISPVGAQGVGTGLPPLPQQRTFGQPRASTSSTSPTRTSTRTSARIFSTEVDQRQASEFNEPPSLNRPLNPHALSAPYGTTVSRRGRGKGRASSSHPPAPTLSAPPPPPSARAPVRTQSSDSPYETRRRSLRSKTVDPMATSSTLVTFTSPTPHAAPSLHASQEPQVTGPELDNPVSASISTNDQPVASTSGERSFVQREDSPELGFTLDQEMMYQELMAKIGEDGINEETRNALRILEGTKTFFTES